MASARFRDRRWPSQLGALCGPLLGYSGHPSFPMVGRSFRPCPSAASAWVLAVWQDWQRDCRFDGSSVPPLALGLMWSTYRAGVGLPLARQAWHISLSRFRIGMRSLSHLLPYPLAWRLVLCHAMISPGKAKGGTLSEYRLALWISCTTSLRLSSAAIQHLAACHTVSDTKQGALDPTPIRDGLVIHDRHDAGAAGCGVHVA